MDSFTRFQAVRQKAQVAATNIEFLSRRIKEQETELAVAETDLQQLMDRKNTMVQSNALLLKIIERFSDAQLQAVKKVVDSALQAIFFDRLYEIVFEITDKRKVKNLDMILVEQKGEHTINSNIRDSVGGGVRTIIGVVLRVYFILYFNQARILFLDEALAKVSELYLPKVMEFFSQLAQDLGFIFVIVTHDEKIMSYAKTYYLVSNGAVLNKATVQEGEQSE